jgi:Zn-dependent protease
MVLVALAGPFSNLLMAIFWGVFYKFSSSMSDAFVLPAILMSQVGLQINYFLMIFNLLPILPLDGGRMLQGLLPYRFAYPYSQMESYGIWIFLFLILSGALSKILNPPVYFLISLTIELLGIQ